MNKWATLFCFLISTSCMAEAPLTYGYAYSHHSKAFNANRRYMVSLPEQYLANQLTYPVLYVIDADFQFHHVANTTRHLARMGKIPPMIVVGVANQGPSDYLKSNTWALENSAEYGGIETFSQYLSDELVPLISNQYRTNTKNALAGYSLGGLYVMQSYLDSDSPFSAFIAMSPSIWYDDYSYQKRFENHLQTSIAQKTTLAPAIANSTSPNKTTPKPLFISLANEKGMGVNALVNLLKQHPAAALNWQFKHYPEETHYSTALPALYDALLFLAPNYFIDIGELITDDYQQVLAQFVEKKSLWTGFRFGWLQSYTLAKYFFASKQTDKIDEALKVIKREFPDSYDEVLINFALGFNRKQAFDEAMTLLQKIAKTNQQNAKWHYQLSLALAGLKQTEKASEHHRKAVELAQSQQLESWEIWELEPDKLDRM